MTDDDFEAMLVDMFERLPEAHAAALSASGLARNLSPEQVKAALGWVATDPNPPKVPLAGRIRAQLDRAAKDFRVKAVEQVEAQADPGDPKIAALLAHCRERLKAGNFQHDYPPARLVLAYWSVALARSAGLLGWIEEAYWESVRADLLLVTGGDDDQAEKGVQWLVNKYAEYLTQPETLTPRQEDQLARRRKMRERMAKLAADAERESRGLSPKNVADEFLTDARRDVRNEKRRDEMAVVKRRVEVAGWAGEGEHA